MGTGVENIYELLWNRFGGTHKKNRDRFKGANIVFYHFRKSVCAVLGCVHHGINNDGLMMVEFYSAASVSGSWFCSCWLTRTLELNQAVMLVTFFRCLLWQRPMTIPVLVCKKLSWAHRFSFLYKRWLLAWESCSCVQCVHVVLYVQWFCKKVHIWWTWEASSSMHGYSLLPCCSSLAQQSCFPHGRIQLCMFECAWVELLHDECWRTCGRVIRIDSNK